MPITTINKTLDVSLNTSQWTVNASRGSDSAIQIHISFVNEGTPISLADASAVSIMAMKPDGSTYILNACTINNDNTVDFVLTKQVCAVDGYMKCTCVVSTIGGAVLYQPYFTLLIAPSSATSFTSVDEYTAITQAVGQAIAAKTAIDNMDATATVTNTVGTPSVTVTKSTVSDHTRFNFAFDNIKGNTGETGATGAAAGFGTPSISVSGLPAGSSPTATVSASGADTSKIFAFNFSIPQGAKGDTGDTGAKGDTGEKGDTGDSGVYIGTTPPTNGANVWINPNGSAAYGMYDGTVTVG